LDSKFNLHYILEIDLWESILGSECEFKVFEENIKCNIKPFAKPGDMFLLIGKGYPNGRYKTNLIIEIKVKDLRELNDEQLELVRKIKEIGDK
jgi:DnaJ-class molecular chaperone